MMPNCAPSAVFRPPGTSPWLGLGSFRVLMMRVLTPPTWWAPQSPPPKWGTSFWFSGCWRALAKGTAWAFLLLCNATTTNKWGIKQHRARGGLRSAPRDAALIARGAHPPPETPRWPAGFPVLVGACQFGTAWAGLRLNSFIHSFALIARAGTRDTHARVRARAKIHGAAGGTARLG